MHLHLSEILSVAIYSFLIPETPPDTKPLQNGPALMLVRHSAASFFTSWVPTFPLSKRSNERGFICQTILSVGIYLVHPGRFFSSQNQESYALQNIFFAHSTMLHVTQSCSFWCTGFTFGDWIVRNIELKSLPQLIGLTRNSKEGLVLLSESIRIFYKLFYLWRGCGGCQTSIDRALI